MLQTYLMTTETLVAVVGPFLVSLWAFGCGPLTARQWQVFAWGTLASLLTARWELSSDAQQLFILPAVLMWIAYDMYRHRPWKARQAYAATFLSLWMADMLHAANFKAMGGLAGDAYYGGVGGAGYSDGLFIDPLAAAAICVYARWRQGHSRKTEGLLQFNGKQSRVKC